MSDTTNLCVRTGFRIEDRDYPANHQLGITIIADSEEEVFKIITAKALTFSSNAPGDLVLELVKEEVVSIENNSNQKAWRADVVFMGRTTPWDITVLADNKEGARDLCLTFLRSTNVIAGKGTSTETNPTIETFSRSGQPMIITFEEHTVVEN